MVLSILEVKGLILPSEVNRRKQDTTKAVDPVVEVRLENFNKQILKQFSSDPVKNRRQVIFGGHQNKDIADAVGDFVVDLGLVSHSGSLASDKTPKPVAPSGDESNEHK